MKKLTLKNYKMIKWDLNRIKYIFLKNFKAKIVQIALIINGYKLSFKY